MGPTIALDKSSIQSLSRREVVLLNNLYFLNIFPILTVEILGDLKKATASSLTQSDVYHLSRKLLGKDSALNVNYRHLILASLEGRDIETDGRPLVGGGRFVENFEGKSGVIFDESPEEQAINRWQQAEFTEAERVLSETWRQATQEIDLEAFQRSLKEAFSEFGKVKDLDELLGKVDLLITSEDPDINRELLALLLYVFPIPPNVASSIFLRWEQKGSPSIQLFASYAFYCFRIFLLFMFGLQHNLIGTRRTNIVDMEYLFYLPFTKIFSSRDDLHRKLAPLFLNDDQVFVDGDELKADLSSILDSLDSESDEVPHAPPESENFLSRRLWQQFGFRSPGRDVLSELTEEEKTKIVERLNRMREGANPSSEPFDSKGITFIQRHQTYRPDDLCPCGSGKQFKDCHLPEIDKSS